MRGSTWMALAVMAATVAACSPKQQATAPAPAAPVAAPAAMPAPAPAAPTATDQAAPATATAEATPAAEATPTAVSPPSPEIVRFSPGDYPAQERRIDGLIANAVSRDTTGDTQREAAEARAQRARCTTRTCIKRSYAAEEARLRRWEGSSDVK